MAINLYGKASVDGLLSFKLSVGDLTNGATTTINATAPTTDQVLSFDGTELKWATVAGGTAVWGGITGTLSDQTDLNTVLNLKAPLASPTFTGNPTAPTPATSDNDTSVATTAFVKAQGYLTDAPSDSQTYGRNNGAWTVVSGGGGSVSWGGITGTLSDQTDLQSALDLKAPLSSPAFDGTATFTGSGGTVSLSDLGLDLSASTGGGAVTVGTSGITFSDSTNQQTAYNPDRAMADAIANVIYTQSSGSSGDICFSNVPQFISNLTTSWGIVDSSAFYEYCTGFSGATYSLSGSVGSGPYKVRVNGTDSSFTI